MYVAYDGGKGTDYNYLIRRNEDGNTWIVPNGTNPYNLRRCVDWFSITGIAIAPDDPNKLWVSFGGFIYPYAPHSRVFESDDGGVSFADITSEDLPNLQVNCISAMGDQTNGYKVFIGNDLGVFMYDTHYGSWSPFNHNLPPAIVTSIEQIDSDPNNPGPESLRISTYGYGIWETPFDCGLGNGYDIISGNEIWNTDRKKDHNVYVVNGGFLTITAKISFVEGAGIIVERGGCLYVNGGTLTNACTNLWNGVEVLGDPTSIRNPQGYARFDNAIVENAIHGVYTLGGRTPDHINGAVQQAVPDPKHRQEELLKLSIPFSETTSFVCL